MIENPFIPVFTNRSFRNLWLGQITSQIALNMLSFVLVIRVYQLTGSNTAVSFILLAFAVPAILFGVVAGGLVDNFDKRSVLLFCNAFRVLLLVVFFLLSANIFFLYFLTVIISVITQLFIPAEAPSIPHLVSGKSILPANSLFTVSFYLSTVLGFVVAGPFLKIFGPANIYLIMCFFMVVATYFVYRLPSIRPEVHDRDIFGFRFMHKTIHEGIKFIHSNSRIYQSLILMTFSQALIATLSVLTPGFADRVLSIDLNSASYLIMGPAAIGLVTGALWVGAYGFKFLKGSIILLGIIATGLTLMLLSLLTRANLPSIVVHLGPGIFVLNNLFIAIVCLFFIGLFNAFISVPANTILQEDTKSDFRGRIYGVLTSLTSGVSILPVVFSGLLADSIGVGRTLSVIGVIVCVIGLYVYRKRRRRYLIIEKNLNGEDINIRNY